MDPQWCTFGRSAELPHGLRHLQSTETSTTASKRSDRGPFVELALEIVGCKDRLGAVKTEESDMFITPELPNDSRLTCRSRTRNEG